MAQPDTLVAISASAVGEYVYCARAWSLRQVISHAPDPVDSAHAAQDSPGHWRPDRQCWRRRDRQRDQDLHLGRQAHTRHDHRLRLAFALTGLGLLCIIVALLGLLLSTGLLPHPA